jgi:uncharacterized protein YjbI with pentapeptide repeats
LTGANLSHAELNEAVLSGADLTEAKLSGADLSDADLSDADLRGVDLTEVVGLTPQKLKTAIMDKTTKLADELRPQGQ